jgi:signal transduction histidine kinase
MPGKSDQAGLTGTFMTAPAPVRNLLLVDDDPRILDSLRRTLRGEGYRIHTAENGRDGLDILKNNDVGVVLSDQMMPGMDGIAFLEEVRHLKPDTIRIMLTASNSFDNASGAINRANVFGYLVKPWQTADLKAFLRRGFEHHELVAENRRLQRLTDEQNEHLRESRNMLQSVLDAISDPLVLVDEQLDILLANREAFFRFQNAHPLDSGKASLREQLNGLYGSTLTDSIRFSVRDASPSICRAEVEQADFKMDEISVFPVRERSETQRASVLRIRDVTDEKRMERKLCQDEKLRSLELLLTGLLHEINNPSNFILFNTPILGEYLQHLLLVVEKQGGPRRGFAFHGLDYEGFKEDLLRLVGTLESGAKRIDESISHLQKVSRERGIGRKCILKPGELIEKAISICQGRIRKTVTTIDIGLEENLRPVVSDPGALEQILIAILLNAAQAADKKDSTIRLRASAGKTWKERLVIEIEDNGCGMDKKTQERIFEPFFTTKQYGAGIGMGLYKSRNLVEDLGGTITVESRPKEGAKFRIVIPDLSESPGTCC